MKHSVSLEHQGKLFRTVNANAASVWTKTTQSLPSAQMKFALNAASDTLPHNAKLALWRKGDHLSADCKLCGKSQTLCHVLNNCKVALELRIYNTRHDDVLRNIEESLIQIHYSLNSEFAPSYTGYPSQLGRLVGRCRCCRDGTLFFYPWWDSNQQPCTLC